MANLVITHIKPDYTTDVQEELDFSDLL
jgi:tRNA uracil 4-sulfurtransferase